MPCIALGGDVMLGRKVGAKLGDRPPSATWGRVGEVFCEADAAMVNLECVIAEAGSPAPGRTFHFQAPPAAVDVLQAADIDAVSLANNHVLDMGSVALEESLERLGEAGIQTVGAGRDLEEAWRPIQLEADELELAVIAFTDNTPEWDIARRQPGLAYATVDPDSSGFTDLAREIEGLARENDLVIASAHWGPNMRRRPPPRFRRFARGLIDAGADVFWGHSAHLFQAVEPYGDGLILYDTGDLVDDYRIDSTEHNEISFVFLVHAGPRRVHRVELAPVQIDPRACCVDLADASARSFAFSRMMELCEEIDTEPRVEEEKMVVSIT